MSRTRNDRKEQRRDEAQIRQELCDEKSPQQRLARLDQAFGKGKGAKAERAKLNKLIQDKQRQR